jgi:hypothetical protein
MGSGKGSKRDLPTRTSSLLALVTTARTASRWAIMANLAPAKWEVVSRCTKIGDYQPRELYLNRRPAIMFNCEISLRRSKFRPLPIGLLLLQQENVLKEETPSEARDRQSPNFVQSDTEVRLMPSRLAISHGQAQRSGTPPIIVHLLLRPRPLIYRRRRVDDVVRSRC